MTDQYKGVSPIVNPATRYRHRDGTERGVDRRIACEKAYRRAYEDAAQDVLSWLAGIVTLPEEAQQYAQSWLAELRVWRQAVDERGSMAIPPVLEEVKSCE